ncbi:MAG: glycosyltransferase family 39 protein [Candidatus Kerfeldbacteria bacterium]|nr:glycosyltransferase family 39 protein [Candidatus Kerfeldbacteria bacterium]
MPSTASSHPRHLIEDLALVAGSAVALFVGIGVLFAVLGVFEKTAVAAAFFAIGVGAVALFVWMRRGLSWRLSRTDIASGFIILTFALLTSVFHHDLPLGRDDMGYLTAAVKVVESRSLAFEDVISRPYHPFRVVEGDVFTSQFLPGYVVYLASWILFGGLEGALVANGLLAGVFLLVMFALSRRLHSDRAGLFTVLFLSTTYLMQWFPRRTVSENLFALCLWLGVLFIVRGVQEKDLRFASFGLFPIAMSTLIRGEGVAYLAMAALLVLGLWIMRFKSGDRRQSLQSAIIGIAAFAPYILSREYTERFSSHLTEYTSRAATGAIGTLFGAHIIGVSAVLVALCGLSFPLRRIFEKRFSKNWSRVDIGIVLVLVAAALFELWFVPYLRRIETIDWTYLKTQFVFENLFYYLVLPWSVIGVLALFARRVLKTWWVPLILLLPAFVFVLDPHIAVDQPWFMRRFIATIVPLSFLFASLGVSAWVKNIRQAVLVGVIGVLVNLSISSPLLLYVDHKGVQPQIQSLAREFKPNDLLIMEPGWRWQQWGYALHYLYDVRALPNWDGLSEQELFTLIAESDDAYILSSRRSLVHPLYNDSDLEFVREWNLTYPNLIPTTWITSYVDDEKRNLSVFKIRTHQKDTPPRKIEEREETYFLFRVQSSAIPHSAPITVDDGETAL